MILLASDHAGVHLKRQIAELLEAGQVELKDLGVYNEDSADYPDLAHDLAHDLSRRTANGERATGILVCGTGLGMSMAANRHAGVRAALCHDAFTAEMARRHNDANVLCLGSRVLGAGVAEQIVRVFLDTPFDNGRHQRRVGKIELDSK
jgi:ribose 5-phosphate isomerase B